VQGNESAITPPTNNVITRNDMLLQPHWREQELQKINLYFDSPTAHNSAFFLLTVEESRVAVMNAEEDSMPLATPPMFKEDVTDSVYSTKSSFPGGMGHSSGSNMPGNSLKWLDCEIMNIIAESEFGTLPQPCDPRLGSVWIVNVAIRTPNVSLDETVASPNKMNTQKPPTMAGQIAKESSLAGGDLLLLTSSAWDHPLLGIVQPWDPDYDWKFSMSFPGKTGGMNGPSNHHLYTSNSTQNISSAPFATKDTFYNDNTSDLTMANILVCVDGGDGMDLKSIDQIGGWASQGTIYTGVNFQMAALGKHFVFLSLK
jgi:hypothetical protein